MEAPLLSPRRGEDTIRMVKAPPLWGGGGEVFPYLPEGERIPSGEKTPSPCGYSPFQVGESIRMVKAPPLGGGGGEVSQFQTLGWHIPRAGALRYLLP